MVVSADNKNNHDFAQRMLPKKDVSCHLGKKKKLYNSLNYRALRNK